MTVYGDKFWMVLDGDDVVWVGSSETDAHGIAEVDEYWRVVECHKKEQSDG